MKLEIYKALRDGYIVFTILVCIIMFIKGTLLWAFICLFCAIQMNRYSNKYFNIINDRKGSIQEEHF